MSNVLPRLSAGDLNLSNATSSTSARVPAFCPFTPPKKDEGIKARFNDDGGLRKMKYQDRRETGREEISGGWVGKEGKGKEARKGGVCWEGLNSTHEWTFDNTGPSGLNWRSEANAETWKKESDKGKKKSGHDNRTAKASSVLPLASTWSFTPSVRTPWKAST